MNQSTIEPDGRLERLRTELEDQAEVFEDPGAYLAGVEDVFRSLQMTRPARKFPADGGDELPPPGGWFG